SRSRPPGAGHYVELSIMQRVFCLPHAGRRHRVAHRQRAACARQKTLCIVRSNRVYPQTYMKADRNPAVPALLEESPVYLGSGDIGVDRYLTQEFHDLEMEKVWRKTWQVACHESELSNVGDTVVYD